MSDLVGTKVGRTFSASAAICILLTSSCTNMTSRAEMNVTSAGVVVPSAKMLRPQATTQGDAAPSLPSTFRDNAFILRDSIWTTHTIPVCWESLTTSSGADRALVKQAVDESWAAHSKLVFVGWQQCPAAFNGIRIQVDDSGPHTKALGRFIAGIPNGMVLNFTFRNWSESCQQERTFCISSIAVHEFGHAIGFAHEQNRPDKPGECREKPQGTDGDVMLTSWDPRSVMNYCNSRYNNGGELSELDTYAVQQLYG